VSQEKKKELEHGIPHLEVVFSKTEGSLLSNSSEEKRRTAPRQRASGQFKRGRKREITRTAAAGERMKGPGAQSTPKRRGPIFLAVELNKVERGKRKGYGRGAQQEIVVRSLRKIAHDVERGGRVWKKQQVGRRKEVQRVEKSSSTHEGKKKGGGKGGRSNGRRGDPPVRKIPVVTMLEKKRSETARSGARE